MKLTDFWPSEGNILQCIKPDAESDWQEVFLAVHQPMCLTKRALVPNATDGDRIVTESDILAEFLKDDPSGRVIMPIFGDSGSGKSHLVKWLSLQLEMQPDASRRHIIRIPKNASLKSVLGFILDDLVGEQYDEIKRQLKAAREQLDTIGAEESILSGIRAEIRRRYDEARQNREDAKLRGEKVRGIDDEWFTHGNPQRGLPALLSDPVTSQLFMAGTGERIGIISELAKHLTTDSSDERLPRRDFKETDLVVPDDLDINEASDIAKRYLQTLDRQNGRERKTAVRLLNIIVDPALEPLASPTDTTLSEIFLAIRRQLLGDGLELALLVEDFAVLSGIQGALLAAMVPEAVRDGVNDACVMRTAMAVTTGYDFGRYDTVKTRAVYGWYVDEVSHDGDDQVVERICDYVGAYLNAARFGADGLKRIHNEYDDDQWPPRFGEDADLLSKDRQQLNAFGTSRAGWPLFPFNRAAIRQMSNQFLRDADKQLRLNPRDIINHVLKRVLRDCRSAWVQGRFPSEEFLGDQAHRLSAALQAEVKNVESNRSVLTRYLALLRYWGDCPENVAETALPSQVYEAFGLTPLPHSGRNARNTVGQQAKQPAILESSTATPVTDNMEPIVVHPTGTGSPPISPQEVNVTSQHPEEVRRWDRKLNDWNPTSTLPQTEAKALRKMIANHVLGAIDWDSLLLKKLTANEMSSWTGYVYLPSAKGTGNVSPENAMCTICTNEEFASIDQRNTAVLALIALTRHEHYQGWNYPEAELDYARVQNLLDRLIPQATEWLLAKRYRGFSGDPVPALAETILLSARFLDVEPAHTSDFTLLLNALFSPAPELSSPLPGDEWAEFKCEAAKHYKVLQQELLARVAVRQGGSDKRKYGVDTIRLIESVRAFKSNWKCTTPLPECSSSPEVNEAIAFAKRFSARLSSAVQKRQQKLVTIRQQCQSELGDDFDKTALVATLKNLVPEAQRLGLLSGDLPRPKELLDLCEDFRLAKVSDTLKKLAATESADFGTQVSSLAQIDDGVLNVIERFISMISRTLDALEQSIQAELTAGEGLLEASKERIEQALDRTSDQLNSIGGPAT